MSWFSNEELRKIYLPLERDIIKPMTQIKIEERCWPEITADTPLYKVREIHRTIWNFVIQNLLTCSKSINFTISEIKPKTPYRNNCALCEYSCKKDGISCSVCPAISMCGSSLCNHEGEYAKWRDAIILDKLSLAVKLAIDVRDIPFKGLDD